MKRTALLVAMAVSVSPVVARADTRVLERPLGDLPPLALDLYGWAQPRFTLQQKDERPHVDFRPSPAFTVIRTRLGAAALLGDVARLQIEVELAREVAQPIDAYLVVTPLMRPEVALGVTLGQFRVPFSRQNLLPSKAFQLPDVAYFATPKFLVDRDIGAMVTADFFGGRARSQLGIFNGNEPGRGQTQNADPYFLFAGRVEASPFGPAPRFEGDVRPLADRSKFRLTIGGSLMRNRLEDKHYQRTYLGGDVGAWWQGASIYGEVYRRTDRPVGVPAAAAPAAITAEGYNVQAGYFLPIPWVREHIELVGRVERFDPDKEVTAPANDAGARDLDQGNPTWGYVGFAFGMNLFWDRGHDLKLQASYEVRNETKRCLEGQTGAACTGYIDNDLFVVQATGAF